MTFWEKVWKIVKQIITFQWITRKPTDAEILDFLVNTANRNIEEYNTKLNELKECFYGTWVDRPDDSGVNRKAHAQDGWRHGKSHPFYLDGHKYDRKGTGDKNKILFQLLQNKLREKYGIVG